MMNGNSFKRKTVWQNTFLICVVFTLVYLGLWCVELVLRSKVANYYSLANESPEECRLGVQPMQSLVDGGFRNSDYVLSSQDFGERLNEQLCLNGSGYSQDEFGKRQVTQRYSNLQHYEINPFGLRGKDWTKNPLDLSKKTIGVFGGSTVFGHMISDENTIPYLLSTTLTERGLENNTFNFGVPGSNAQQDYNALKWAIGKTGIDIAVFLNGFNDTGKSDINLEQLGSSDHYKGTVKSIQFLERIASAFAYVGLQQTANFLNLGFQTIATVKLSQLEKYVTFSLMAEEICKYKNIKCLFVVQPSIYSTQKILTQSEEQFIRQSIQAFPSAAGRTFAYKELNRYWHESGKDFLSGDAELESAIGSMQILGNKEFKSDNEPGLYKSGWDAGIPDLSLVLTKGSEAEIDFILNDDAKPTFSLPKAVGCDRREINLRRDCTFVQTCTPNSPAQMLNFISINRKGLNPVGYKNVLWVNSEEEFTFLFPEINVPSHVATIKIDVSNYRNHEIIDLIQRKRKQQSILSSDSGSYNASFSVQNKNVDAGDALVDAFLLTGMSGDLTGISQLQVEQVGRFCSNDFKQDAIIRIRSNNLGGTLAIPSVVDTEIFLDGAHLTEEGNAILANAIATKIIDS